MTTIIALTQYRRVYMGGDSLITSTDSKGISYKEGNRQKIIRRGDMLLAAAGKARVLDMLEFVLEIPEYSGQEVDQFIAREFRDNLVRAARRCNLLNTMDGGLWSSIKKKVFGHDHEFYLSGSSRILVGYRSRLFSIDGTFSVREHFTSEGVAIGTGAAYAMGAMSVLAKSPDPVGRMKRALDAAAGYDCHTSGPFTIECLDPADDEWSED